VLPWLSCAACAIACDAGDKGAGPTVQRSEQVIATGSMPTAAPGAPSVHAAATASAPRPRLCDGEGNAGGRVLSKVAASHAEAPGTPPLDGRLSTRRGQWTWINFWAAWCNPCKEEIPRLLGWRDRLASAKSPISLVFVSLDDDERQLDSFLAEQPQGGLRSTLWLPDGHARTGWMKSLRMTNPELPQHALVDPDGHVRCFIEGAVEDADYAEIAALVR
jgi:thiol-disulfide isomerase/thioredoxin